MQAGALGLHCCYPEVFGKLLDSPNRVRQCKPDLHSIYITGQHGGIIHSDDIMAHGRTSCKKFFASILLYFFFVKREFCATD